MNLIPLPLPMTAAPILPIGLICFLFFLALTAVSIQYRSIRKRLGDRKALTISMFRLFTLLALISFAFNPSLVRKKEHSLQPSIAVLIDTSETMSQAQSAGRASRLDQARSLLLQGKAPLLATLARDFDVKLYALGASLRFIEPKELSGLKAEGEGGDLNGALESLKGRSAFAIVLSDGNLAWQSGMKTPLPALIVPVGDPKAYRDILVKSVKASPIVFRGRKATIDVTAKTYGYTGLTVPVILKEGSKVIALRNVRIQQDRAEATLSLPFTPEKVGEQTLQVSVPAQAGETLSSNNSVTVSVRSVRDKIRILMVSGSPSMSYRFMRSALKNDPSIDLLSFVILRTPTNILNVPLQEQSLIPFPVETLFGKELESFDLVIFDNLPSHLYIGPGELSHIRQFVRRGGSFAMIGGPNLTDGGWYARTALEEILPVRMSGKDPYRREQPFEVKLSRAGLTHPITQLSENEADNIGLWKEMPALRGINLLQPKAFQNVLLETADPSSRPILAVGDYGKGRVLVLGTDDAWKWWMGMVGQGKGNWAYLRLMERIVRWLTRDPSLEPVQIEALPSERNKTQDGTAPGEPLEVRIKAGEGVVGTAQRTAAGTVSLSVFDPDGTEIGSQLKELGGPGQYVGSFVPEKEGLYRVKVQTPAGSAEEYVVVSGSFRSLDAFPDHEKLKRIAASTGGRVLVRGEDLLKEIEIYKKGLDQIVEERHLPVWGTVCVFLAILFSLGTEWYLRRKWGIA